MKFLKSLAFAATATCVLMLAFGLGAASATKLCAVNSNTTTCSSHYAAGTVIEASLKTGTSMIFETTGGSVLDTCTESSVAVQTRKTGSASETVLGEVFEHSWEGCSNTIVTIVGGLWEFHHIAGTDNATLTIIGPEITMLTSGLSCTYGSVSGSIDLGSVVAGSTGSVSINAILPKIGGSFLCPSDARWKAEYTVAKPAPLYFTAG